MMHPGDVVIRPVDGGFLLEWIEFSEPDPKSPQGMQAMRLGIGMGGMVQKKQACRTTMEEAFALAGSILKRKEMLRKAGQLDMPPEGALLGGTQCFPGPPTPS